MSGDGEIQGRVEVDGLRIVFRRKGNGPPVVFLHGYVGDGSRTWRRQIEDLSDEFTVVAWDAPGSGLSSDPPESFRLPDYADCFAGFVDALGLGRVHLVGLSFGGGLALEIHRRHPTVSKSLVLASAYAGWAGSLPSEVVEERLQQVLQLADLPSEQFARAVMPTMFSASAPTNLVDGFAASVSEFHPVGLRVMALSFAEADLRAALPLVDVPTLLLYGDADVRAPLSVAEAIHAGIATSRLVVLPGVGHVSNIEAPERFNAELRAFFRWVEGWAGSAC
ncbi:MAG TPA: alpha/beta hydrolase [Gaiellaceae bacterium]|nr:alpha/beta hydrolase [Gaiellaceae bacterium]